MLDNNSHILGVITAHSLIEVVDDEMGEDYAKLAGLTAEEDLSEPLSASLKKRMPWLLVLLVLGMCVSSVVGLFEKVISQLTIIMAFQSLILDMAGNVGTQSLAVTIRVLTDENITFKEKLSLVAKEMKIGFSGGVILGVISILFVGLYLMVFKAKTAAFAFAVSACIGAALLLSMVISSAVGTLIPRSCIWSPDNHHQRPCCRGDLLRTQLDTAHKHNEFNRVTSPCPCNQGCRGFYCKEYFDGSKA